MRLNPAEAMRTKPPVEGGAFGWNAFLGSGAG